MRIGSFDLDRSHLLLALAVVGVLLAALAVALGIRTVAERFSHHATLMDRVKAEEVRGTAQAAVSVPDYGGAMIKYSGGKNEFFVVGRLGDIESYPCSGCHTQATPNGKQVLSDAPEAHWDIKLQHKAGDVKGCMTCHNPQDKETLRLLDGKIVPLAQGFQLCEQCHYRQFNDWRGGAHGKRMGYWAGERVVQSCTGCHNPHHPALATRLPATYVVFPESD